MTDNSAAAYRLAGALLVHLRRVLDRAMRKHSGDDWFKTACPTAVFERLIARKEAEIEVDRGGEAYQELITYTDFADISDIISGCDGVARLFRNLATSPQNLTRVLGGLEMVRSHLAVAQDISDDELEDLERTHAAFITFIRQAGKKGKKKSKPAGGKAPWDRLPAPPPRRKMPATTRRPPNVEPVVPPSPEVMPPSPRDAEQWPEAESPAQDDAPPKDETPETVVPEPEVAPEPEEEEFVETFGVEDALAKADDSGVLRALRNEVTVLAEGIYGEPDRRRPAVWQKVTASGWYDAREKRLGLSPLEKFYAMIDRYLRLHDSNPAPEELEKFLVDNDFAKTLLKLREIFLAADVG